MKVAIVGTGYVGLTTACTLAELGHAVTCLDIDEQKINMLKQSQVPFHEPGLDELLKSNLEAQRLRFLTSARELTGDAEIVIVCVGTPASGTGPADISQLKHSVELLAPYLQPQQTIINKCTAPIGTTDLMGEWLKSLQPGTEWHPVSNPEFLREGSAVHDSFHPERIVLGVRRKVDLERALDLYRDIDAPVLVTDPPTAEMIKYASNAFLATKISFINEIANICEHFGVDVTTVAEGMGMDTRIGNQFLQAGVGYGGSCFPKDLATLISVAQEKGYTPRLLQSVVEVNTDQGVTVLRKLEKELGDLSGKTIALLGLSFKPHTDDLRNAPSVIVSQLLVERRAYLRAYDPVVSTAFTHLCPQVYLATDAYDATQGADGLIILTDWPQFKLLNWARIRSLMKNPVLIDGRNMLNKRVMEQLGFTYRGVGRIAPEPRRYKLRIL